MTCHDVQLQLSLYLYGELDFATEEALERHLGDCAFCQQAFAREKTWHAAATSEHRDVSLDLLSRCRQDLRNAIKTDSGKTPAPPLAGFPFVFSGHPHALVLPVSCCFISRLRRIQRWPFYRSVRPLWRSRR